MRTLIALLSTLCLLCGCAAGDSTGPAAELRTLTAQPPEGEEHFTYTTIWDTCSSTACSEDGTELATYRFELPVLLAVRGDESVVVEPQTTAEENAAVVVEAFNERFDKWAAAEEFQEIVVWAEDEWNLRQEQGVQWDPYALELDCSVYQTDRLVSVAGTYYSYTGGAHPNTWLLGWNFDLETGTFLDPEALAEGTDLMGAVTEELIRQAQTPDESGTVPADGYWEGYEAILANWPSCAVTFDETGMQVEFSAYELAPYAAGAQSFHVPYVLLAGHLNETGRALLGLE